MENEEYDGGADAAQAMFGGLEGGEFSGGGVIHDWKTGRPLYALLEGVVIILLLFCLMYSIFGSSPSVWLIILSVVATGLYFAVELVPNFTSKTDEWNNALAEKLRN